MSNERDAIARAFGRPFTKPPKRAPARTHRLHGLFCGLAATAAVAFSAFAFLSPPHSTGLECKVSETEKDARGVTQRPVKNSTWLVEVKNNQWRLVAFNGRDLASAPNESDRVAAQQFHPMRVTDTAYVLMEKKETQTSEWDFSDSALILNRVTGELYETTHTSEPGDPANWTITETTGHCSPASLSAKL
jgi:hypothetical protein